MRAFHRRANARSSRTSRDTVEVHHDLATLRGDTALDLPGDQDRVLIGAQLHLHPAPDVGPAGF